MRARLQLLAFCSSTFLATAAQAAINISTQPTQNMSCSGGVCTATAQKAYLNVNDVTNMLAAGDLKVITAVGAQDIHIAAPFSWTSNNRLTLDAQRSIEFSKPVTVAGTGALTIITNDGGTGGDYWFDHGGSVTFWDRNSSLVVNGASFTLVPGLKTLITDIARHPLRHYALARDYDAGSDGTYTSTITTSFGGIFEGLGHSISNLNASFSANSPHGLFSETIASAVIRDLSVPKLLASEYTDDIGGLVGDNGGLIDHVSVSGKVYATSASAIGGITGVNTGNVTNSSFAGTVEMAEGGQHLGGIVGQNSGLIDRSFFSGTASIDKRPGNADAGGVAGENAGTITNSYETGTVQTVGNQWNGPRTGGLTGLNDKNATVQSSYATGYVYGGGGFDYACTGALIGWRSDPSPVVASYYQDTGLPGVGCDGSEDGITGLTQSQFQSGLPAGFDPTVWGEKPNINNGYPYLLANPPPKESKAAKKVNATTR